jgi:glycosyltransferase involved in cell wall biosynthesis
MIQSSQLSGTLDFFDIYKNCGISLVGLEYLLVLGRAEPENNFEIIIQAFCSIRASYHNLTLLIVSNVTKTAHGAYLYERYAAAAGVCFVLPEYDWRIVKCIRRNAMAYIHGHSAGGTNPSLVEAVAAAKPIFAFDVPYNRYTTAGLVVYFSSASSLLSSLEIFCDQGLDSVTQLSELVNLADKSYDWDVISADYLKLFSAVDQANRPGYKLIIGRGFLRLIRKVSSIVSAAFVVIRRNRKSSSRKLEPRLPNRP